MEILFSKRLFERAKDTDVAWCGQWRMDGLQQDPYATIMPRWVLAFQVSGALDRMASL